MPERDRVERRQDGIRNAREHERRGQSTRRDGAYRARHIVVAILPQLVVERCTRTCQHEQECNRTNPAEQGVRAIQNPPHRHRLRELEVVDARKSGGSDSRDGQMAPMRRGAVYFGDANGELTALSPRCVRALVLPAIRKARRTRLPP
jgi:hypothetical protein